MAKCSGDAEMRVAVLGGGPAGCTLAALLAQRGLRVVVFDAARRPDLLVGESLLPTVVTVLRRLGIEDRAAAFSTRKPGVSFLHRRGLRLDFTFPERAIGGLPNYAYNVPRPQFDNLLRDRAVEFGAVFVRHHAGVVKTADPDGPELRLDEASFAAAAPVFGGRHPDLLVDATGRARLFARALGIGAARGARNDAAYFAHFDGFASGVEEPGRVVISALERGWSWRIPLPGKMSVGIVIDRNDARLLGDTPEQRLETAIRTEPLLADAGRHARRLTPVMSYSNYQLVSERGHGRGWVAVGDAFGFVDPMLSPGLFMALEAATLLDRHAFHNGAASNPRRFAHGCHRYLAELRHWHDCWRELIDYFYDGRIFSLYESGSQLERKYRQLALPRIIERHLTRHIAGMASGANTRSRRSRTLLRLATRHLVWDVPPPASYAILPQPP